MRSQLLVAEALATRGGMESGIWEMIMPFMERSGLLALNLVSPEKFASVIREYAWWFSLAWEPGRGLRFTTPHNSGCCCRRDQMDRQMIFP